jgi:hypothetical protein
MTCREFTDLQEALAAAHSVARRLIRRDVRRPESRIGGTLDVEDEQHRPVARLVLTEVAHQIL